MSITELIRRVENKASPVSAGELALFESELGAPLPEDYRAFLVVTNGGYLGGSLWFTGPTPDGQAADAGLHHLGGLREESHFSLKANRAGYAGRIPEGLMWIADDPFGNAICIGLRGSHRGHVYFWDHELEPGPDTRTGQLETAGNITLLANSFSEFVSGLKSSEEG